MKQIQTETDRILMEYVRAREQTACLMQLAAELKEIVRQMREKRENIMKEAGQEEGADCGELLLRAEDRLGRYAEAIREMKDVLYFLADDRKKTRLDALEMQDRR